MSEWISPTGNPGPQGTQVPIVTSSGGSGTATVGSGGTLIWNGSTWK